MSVKKTELGQTEAKKHSNNNTRDAANQGIMARLKNHSADQHKRLFLL